MNPFDDFGFDDLDSVAPEDVFESLGDAEQIIIESLRDAEQVVERAKQGLYDLLKESIKSALKEAASACEELSALRSEIAHARHESGKWEKKIEEEKLRFNQAKDFDIPKMYLDRIVRNMTGNFAPGDKVYVIKSDGSYQKCPKCKGGKRVDAVIDGETISVKCPECDGSGSKYIKEPPHVEEKTVTGVYLKLCFEENRVCVWSKDTVFLDGSEWNTEIKDIHRTLESAEAALKGE